MQRRNFGTFTIVICLFTAFGGFLFGYDSGNIGGVLAMGNFLSVVGYVNPPGQACGVSGIYQGVEYCISSTSKSLITSFLSIGTLAGALSGAVVADRLGRRGGIILASSVFTIGAAVQTGISNVAGLVVGRVVAGYGVGLLSMMVPMYQSEAAPPQIRGAIVSCYQLAITIGILLAQVIDLGTANIQSTAAWRVPVGLQMLFGLILIIGCFFIPESPRYLVRRGLIEQARANLARMRSQPENSELVNTEMAEIEGNLEYEMSLGTATYADCFRGDMLKRTMCGIFVQMFQQLTGVNFIFYYGTSFFKAAGVSSPYAITVATGGVNVLMTIPGIYLMERAGRRKLLFYGAIWMSACNLIIGAVAVAHGGSSSANTVLIVFTLLFIGAFAATWGPSAWVLISELFPLKLRGKAMSLSTASNWFWNWCIAFVVPYITDAAYGNLGSKIAFIWFVTSFCAAIWTYFFVPETKGWSLEELDEMFATRMPYRKTPSWTPSGASMHGAAGVGETPMLGDKFGDDGSLEKREVSTVA